MFMLNFIQLILLILLYSLQNNTKYFDRIIRVQYRESQEFRNQQIQLFCQQQEI